MRTYMLRLYRRCYTIDRFINIDMYCLFCISLSVKNVCQNMVRTLEIYLYNYILDYILNYRIFWPSIRLILFTLDNNEEKCSEFGRAIFRNYTQPENIRSQSVFMLKEWEIQHILNYENNINYYLREYIYTLFSIPNSFRRTCTFISWKGAYPMQRPFEIFYRW